MSEVASPYPPHWLDQVPAEPPFKVGDLVETAAGPDLLYRRVLAVQTSTDGQFHREVMSPIVGIIHVANRRHHPWRKRRQHPGGIGPPMILSAALLILSTAAAVILAAKA